MKRKSYWMQMAGSLYKRYALKGANLTEENAFKIIKSMLKKAKYAILITNDGGRSPCARTIQPIVDLQTLEIWIGTDPRLRKVEQITENDHVTLAFQNEKEHAGLVMYGKCTIVREKTVNRKRWLNSWILFFPDGPSSQNYLNLHLVPEKIELMNFHRKIVMEPFGLKPLVLEKMLDGWHIANRADVSRAKQM